MKIELREPRPPASEEQVQRTAEAVAESGHPIPDSYRAFLGQQDGGDPVRDRFAFQQDGRELHDRVRVFFGVDDSPYGTLLQKVKAYLDRIPRGTLPIANDSLGNLLLLDGRDGADGPVWFWDHDLEPDRDDPEDVNLSFVASDLRSFLEQLTDAPEPEPEPTERPKGLRRLFSR